MKKIILLIVPILFSALFYAQTNSDHSPIIFIYDASGSMMGRIQGKTKMEIASSVLTDAVNKLPDNQQVGLVAYGHRQKDDCKDVEFLVHTENGNKQAVSQSLKKIKPLGRTPLARSALQVIDHLRQTKMKATIILVTDGIESCGGNICDVIKAAKKEGIDFRLHIIGFGLKANETEQLRCAAKAGEGQYYDAADAGGLGDVLNEATATTVDDPPGNLSVYATKNGQPVDAIIKAWEPGTKTLIKSVRTYRDSLLWFLPPGKYDLEAAPLENSDINAIIIPGVEIIDGKITYQYISFDGGKFKVTATNNGEGWDASVKVFLKGTNKTVATGRTYGKSPLYEVNAGVYDVEITALVIEGLQISERISNLEIKPGGTTEVNYEFKSGIAMIGAKASDGLVDAIVKIVEPKSKKTVATGRTYVSESSNPKKFVLNPGTYNVTITGLGKHAGKNSSFTMTINEAQTFEKVVGL
ncbi:MAG TPA: VWA domain-containing protein [Chitinophagaceae bacterium]|nr:VWA domain-containing protein [Chitinophagaceae bacterium]